MRVGLATSLVAHAVLITLGVVGLHNAEELQPTPIEAISVDLVPIEEVASIRMGSENSKVIETPKPAAVDSPKPNDPAERPGATEKDQPNPQETTKASPAPTVQTAPEPVPEAQPAPTPKETPPPPPPTPEPQKEPEAPAAEPAPELAAEPTTETPAEAPAPVPAMRTASVQRQQAEAKPTPKTTESPKADKPKETKPADQVANIINTEETRGSTTGSGGQAAAGKPTGQAQRLTQSELGALIVQMQRCWNPTLSDRNDGFVVRLMVAMNPDGTVKGMPEILSDVSSSPMLGLAARTAARKIQNCGPFDLPDNKYDYWRQIDVTLDASQAD